MLRRKSSGKGRGAFYKIALKSSVAFFQVMWARALRDDLDQSETAFADF